MKTVWGDGAARKSVVAPVSLIITAFAPVADVRKTWTPQLRTDLGATVLLLVDLGAGANRLGGSSLAQVFGELGSDAAGSRVDPQLLIQPRRRAARSCARRTWCWPITTAPTAACSRRSSEMAFAGHCGLDVKLPAGGERRRGRAVLAKSSAWCCR